MVSFSNYSAIKEHDKQVFWIFHKLCPRNIGRPESSQAHSPAPVPLCLLYLTLGAKNCQIFLNRYTSFWCSSSVSFIQHDQAMLWRHLFEGNYLCQQLFGNCLTATSGFAKNRGLGGTYSVFGPICPLTLPILIPSLNSHWTKRTRVACN